MTGQNVNVCACSDHLPNPTDRAETTYETSEKLRAAMVDFIAALKKFVNVEYETQVREVLKIID